MKEACDNDLFEGCFTPNSAGSAENSALPRDIHTEILIEKDWEGNDCTDGVWVRATRGRGDTSNEDGASVRFGVMVGSMGEGKLTQRKAD